MDSDSESSDSPSDADSLPTDWTAVHIAILQENRQWVHQMNIVDAQNNLVGVTRYTPRQTFEHRYARRLAARVYPHRRTRSVPAPYRTVWRSQPPVLPTRGNRRDEGRFDILRRVKDSGVQKLRRAKDIVVDKLRQGRAASGEKLRWTRDRVEHAVHNIRRRINRRTFISVGVGLGLLVALAYTNGRAAHYKALQTTPASVYIASFASHPTWLHTDPVQVIGLPAQVDPSFIPSRDTIDDAYKTYKSTWHPDGKNVKGWTKQDIDAVNHRGDEARDLLFEYHDNQYCDEILKRIANFDGSSPAGARHFAKHCACTYAKYRRAWWYQRLMPVDLQPDPPKTLEETCPCTYKMAMESWRSFSFDATNPQPPYLDRIKNDLTLATTDPRVLWWRAKGFVFHDDRDFKKDAEAVACALGTHEGCERMEGWTSYCDFNSFARSCSRTRKLPDHKGFIESDGEEKMDESEMTPEHKQALEEEQAAEADKLLDDIAGTMFARREAEAKITAHMGGEPALRATLGASYAPRKSR